MGKINKEELKELFIEFKNGSQQAFEELYTKYNKLVYGIAFSILKNQQDAEDIVQIVFTKIYGIDKNKLPTSKEASWLYTTTKNEAIAHIRRKNNSVDLESIYEIEDTNDEIGDVLNQDSYSKMISKLSDKEKEIVSLKVIANLSFRQIGKLLNQPTGTVKWRYYKATKTLKLMISNLAIAVITFAIGLKASLKDKKYSKEEQELVKTENEIEIDIAENLMQDTESVMNKEYANGLWDETYREEAETKQEIIEEKQEEESTNYMGYGMFSMSAIFFAVSTVFLIICVRRKFK